MDITARFFAYGTLITGALDPGVDRLLARWCRRLARGSIPGRLYDLGRYPAAVPSNEPGHRVLGWLFETQDPVRVLAALDRYEGVSPERPKTGTFRRVLVQVAVSDQPRTFNAWAYYYNRPPGRPPVSPEGTTRPTCASAELHFPAPPPAAKRGLGCYTGGVGTRMCPEQVLPEYPCT